MKLHALRLPVALLALVLLAPATGTRPATASVLQQIEAVSNTDLGFLTKHYISDGKVLFAVRGKKERRQVRFANALRALSRDKQEVYRAAGWPHSRYQVNDSWRITEVWAYYDTARAYEFDEEGRLIGVRWF